MALKGRVAGPVFTFVAVNYHALKKRTIDVAVISDVHLGTTGCRAEELLAYLSSINPSILVLNGDIIDAWNLRDRYFPPSHTRVLRKIIHMASTGTEVYYITGNHDDMLRGISGTAVGNFRIVNKLALALDGRKAWIFHGDVLDHSVMGTRWLTRLGHFGYGLLLRTNRMINWLLVRLGREKFSLSGHIKKQGSGHKCQAERFKNTAGRLAIDQGYDYVVCGHTHLPEKAWVENGKGRVLYLNSGDWVESLTALEYAFKRWKLYRYNEDKLSPFFSDEALREMDIHELIASITNRQDAGRRLGALEGLTE